MLNRTERRKLLKDFADEPAMPYVVLAKCAAGLAIVVGITLVGIYAPPEASPVAMEKASVAARP
jgi:hypothetical protein